MGMLSNKTSISRRSDPDPVSQESFPDLARIRKAGKTKAVILFGRGTNLVVIWRRFAEADTVDVEQVGVQEPGVLQGGTSPPLPATPEPVLRLPE